VCVAAWLCRESLHSSVTRGCAEFSVAWLRVHAVFSLSGPEMVRKEAERTVHFSEVRCVSKTLPSH